jgi:hypothetical protein
MASAPESATSHATSHLESGSTLTGANDRQLERCKASPGDRQYVNVNGARGASRRCERQYAGRAGQRPGGAGKVVRLIRPNALVGALLETLHLDARVQLVRAAAP